MDNKNLRLDITLKWSLKKIYPLADLKPPEPQRSGCKVIAELIGNVALRLKCD